ncbi:gluconokinase [Nocardia neocaledoniensis NBRC 108232]|uniref:Gluconokinase n=2 Tax=Nocardia neocaledoniensis TaxID=236511 RepID=A0A317NJD5_9NOCA|nr:gluconate kinase (SKI family) [Nocardia neocaledoniensis]GEM32795.1 gluconokinase [Nocardia neocaledoniensis NBRC 108232]
MVQPVIVVMGVSGCGKTTVGALAAQRLEVPYAEGDDFHPVENIEKMAAGIPLTDEDRWPWLDTVATWLGDHQGSGGVASCSALRRTYRDRLRAGAPDTYFVHLAATREELLRRMTGRLGHFMPTILLDSQLDTLEPLEPDEPGVSLNALAPPNILVTEAIDAWRTDHR